MARWLRNYHLAVAGFQPPKDARWREGTVWRPGLIVGHNDAAPYNAVWTGDGQLRGFFDWDLAAPVTREWNLAFTAFAWVPLRARHIVQPEGFPAFSQRPPRDGPLRRQLCSGICGHERHRPRRKACRS